VGGTYVFDFWCTLYIGAKFDIVSTHCLLTTPVWKCFIGTNNTRHYYALSHAVCNMVASQFGILDIRRVLHTIVCVHKQSLSHCKRQSHLRNTICDMQRFSQWNGSTRGTRKAKNLRQGKLHFLASYSLFCYDLTPSNLFLITTLSPTATIIFTRII